MKHVLHHHFFDASEMSLHKLEDGRYLATIDDAPIGLVECHDVPGRGWSGSKQIRSEHVCVWEPTVRNVPGLTLAQEDVWKIERALKGRKRARKHALEDLRRAYSIAGVALPHVDDLAA